MWSLNHCRMARVVLPWIVSLILPVMSAPRASAQTASLDPAVNVIEARLTLDDMQIAALKSQVAVLEEQNNNLQSEVASLRTNDALQRTVLDFTKLEDEILKANTTNAAAIQSLKTELANIRAGQTGAAVKAPFEVVGSSGQPLFRVVERGGGEVLIMQHGTPMIELGPGSKGNPGLRIAGPAGVDDNVAFVGRIASGGVINVHSDTGGAAVGMEAGGSLYQLAVVGSDGRVAASLRLVDGRRGALVIFDPAGNTAVAATTKPSGLGEVVVQAGPDAVAWMRVADDLTGGYNCAVRKGGTWCVGINLPLTLGGK